MTDGNPIQVTTFMSLPEEILGQIFNKLTQNEVLKIRVVCKKWKTEIDTHYNNWNIRLDDKAPSGVLAHILQLRIKTCTVVSLFEPLRNINPNNPNRIFKHPNLIRKFDAAEVIHREPIKDEEHLMVISPQNLSDVLKNTSKNLRKLCLAFSDRILTKPFPYEDLMGWRFAALETLDIHCYIKKFTLSVNVHPNNLLHELVNIPIPKLRSLKFYSEISSSKLSEHFIVRLSEPDQYRMSFDFLAFLANHGNVLKNVVFDMPYTDDEGNGNVAPPVADLDSLDLNLTGLRQIKSLKELELGLMNKTESTLTAAWRQLILQQIQLRELGVRGLTIYSKGLRDIIQNNFTTMTSMKIHDFIIPETILDEDGYERCTLDFSMFEFCQRLEDFSLDCVNSEKALPEPLLRNLSKLPKSLVEVELSNVKIHPVDIIHFIRRHKSLKSLSLQNCGCEREDMSVGVNGSVLDYILNGSCANLKVVFIRQLNSSGEGELQKLQSIFSNAPFNCPLLLENYENVKFRLAREPWKVTDFYKGLG